MFALNIDTGNSAFGHDSTTEIARILKHIAYRVEKMDLHRDLEEGIKIYDINGNAVGMYWLRD